MGRKNFWSDLGVNCKIEKIQVMAIVETKSENPPDDIQWKGTGFDNMVYCPASGFSSGMCVL